METIEKEQIIVQEDGDGIKIILPKNQNPPILRGAQSDNSTKPQLLVESTAVHDRLNSIDTRIERIEGTIVKSVELTEKVVKENVQLRKGKEEAEKEKDRLSRAFIFLVFVCACGGTILMIFLQPGIGKKIKGLSEIIKKGSLGF